MLLSDLRPRTKHLVYDLVVEAGYDTTEWRESSRDPRRIKANPRFCYEWSYLQAGKVVILNLWHSNMIEDSGDIILRENFRADGEAYKTVNQKPEWARRAQQIDQALRTAIRDNLPVRVIILDGNRRDKSNPNSAPSRVMRRELDSEPWTIAKYDWSTGATELRRGILTLPYVDQFDLDQAQKSGPERRHQIGSAFVRDPAVRRRALARAAGRCALCGARGFRMESGALYLETHHVIPLGEGGADDDGNVVALCAHDHRRAHFGEDRLVIRDQLLTYARRAGP